MTQKTNGLKADQKFFGLSVANLITLAVLCGGFALTNVSFMNLTDHRVQQVEESSMRIRELELSVAVMETKLDEIGRQIDLLIRLNEERGRDE